MGVYYFLLNNVNPVIELHDENDNDITDRVKNISQFYWEARSIGWENGSQLDELDPSELYIDEDNLGLDTDEEITAAQVELKQTMVKAMHCDLSSITNDNMAKTWKRLADGEIQSGRFLHELFASEVEDELDGEEWKIISSNYHSDSLAYVISYNIEWEGEFDINKLVVITAGDEEFNIEPLNTEYIIHDEQVFLSYIIYDGKMFEGRHMTVLMNGEEMDFGEDVRDELDWDEYQYWYEPISKSEIEDDQD